MRLGISRPILKRDFIQRYIISNQVDGIIVNALALKNELLSYDFINNSLPALEKRNHTYNLTLEEDFTSIDIEMKMIFRALKPEFFNESNNYLINTIPVYEIASTSKTIFNYIEINQ